MHIKIATAVVLSLAFAPQQRGWVSSVTAAPDGNAGNAGTVQVTVRGNNPCGAVSVEFGDGTAATTHTIQQLPLVVPHEYTRTGDYRVRARGMGNCDGDVFTSVNVSRVRSAWLDRTRPNTETRFSEMDQNRDGVITRAEWRGTAQAFDVNDWNNDGRLSGDEVREGAQRQFDWTEAQFRRFDRNRDNYLSGTEWRYEQDDLQQVDRNRDGRVSLSEFLDGDNVRNNGNNGRGRGRGRGRGNQDSPDPSVTVRVTNRVLWTDTGLDVRVGDTLNIDASGTIQFSTRVADTSGPEGAAGHPATNGAPMPNRNIGALIARAGNSGPFLAGDRNNLRVPQTGRLYLGVNDDNLRDNSGEYRVIVSVNRAR